MICKNCPYMVWFGDYALHYCDITKDKVEPNQKCSCEDRRNKPRSMTIPCSIGDTVWTIRNYSGNKKIMPGKVSEMFFVGTEMRLCIVVKGIARGYWGHGVYGTYEEAKKAFEEAEHGVCD